MKTMIRKWQLFICLSIVIVLFSCNQKKQTMSTDSSTNNNGLIIKESQQGFEETYEKLRSTLDANPNLKIILELDHSKNAASKDLELRPTRIIVFGNPMLGTPLMQSQPTVAIDLPQKVLVYEEAGTVYVAYNNPLYLKERHAISDKDDVLAKISGALDKITDVATK